MAKTYRCGDFVKYEGTINRFASTWWTVAQVNRDRTGRVYDYTLETKGVGRLRHVSPAHVNQDRQDPAC